jgi:hypothetical protein
MCFVTEDELHKTALMCGAIAVNVLAGRANIVSFDMRH